MWKEHDARKSSILRELTLKWFTGNQVCVKFVQYKTHSVFLYYLKQASFRFTYHIKVREDRCNF